MTTFRRVWPLGVAWVLLAVWWGAVAAVFGGPWPLLVFGEMGALAFGAFLVLWWRAEEQRHARNLEDTRLLDPTTGLLGPVSLVRTLNAELDRSRRLHRELALLYLDLDYFGRFVTAHGLIAKDRTLGELGALIRAQTRRYDAAFHLGRDEFAILLPETTRDQARQIAERLRVALDREHGEELTLSIGLAAALAEDDADHLLAHAEEALGEARRQGGNRIRGYVPR